MYQTPPPKTQFYYMHIYGNELWNAIVHSMQASISIPSIPSKEKRWFHF